MPKPFSLRSHLIIAFILQIVGITAVVGYLSYRSGQRAVEDLAYQLLAETSQRTTQNLNSYLQDAHQVNQTVIATLTSNTVSLDQLDQLHDYLIGQLRQQPNITSLHVGTVQGDFRVVHRVSRREIQAGLSRLTPDDVPIEAGRSDPNQPSRLNLYALDSQGQVGRFLESIDNLDVRERPWFQQAVATGAPGWSAPFQIGASNLLALNAYAPLYDDARQLQGVVSVNVSIERLSYFLKPLSIGKTGQMFVVEPSGLLVASSTGELPYTAVPIDAGDSTTEPGRVEFQQLSVLESADPLTRLAAQQLQQAFGDLAAIQAVHELEIKPQRASPEALRQPYYLQVAPFQDDYGLDWLIVTVVPQSDFTATIDASVRRTIWFCGLVLLGGVAVALWLSRRITQPITALGRASQTFVDYLECPVLPASTIREVETLRCSFEAMVTQLKTALAKTEASEQRLATILESLPIGVSVYNAEGDFVFINSKGREIFPTTAAKAGSNRPAEECQLYVVGTDTLYSPEKLPLMRALRGETVQVDDIEVAMAGRRVPLEVVATPVFNSGGQIVYVINAFYDISQRRQVEQARAVFNESTDAMFLVDATTLLIVDCNQRAVELFEVCDRNQLVGLDGNTLQKRSFTPTEIERIRQTVEKQGFWSLEVEYVTRQGNSFWGLLSAKPIQMAGQEFHLVKVTDISDRKRSEMALQHSEATQAAILRSIPDLLLRLKGDGTYLGCISNGEVAPACNLSANPDDNTIANLMPPHLAALRLHHIRQALATGELQRYQQAIEIRGELCYEECRIAKVGADEVLVMVRDITEQVRAETQLQDMLTQEQAIARITAVVHSSLDLDTVLSLAMEKLRQLLECDRSFIYRFSAEGGRVVAAAPEPLLQSTEELLQVIAANWLQRSDFGVEVVPQIDAEQPHLWAQLQVGAYIAIPICNDPLCHAQTLWGVLYLCRSTACTWPAHKVYILTQAVIQVGLAVQKAELFQQLQQQSQALETARDKAEAASRAKSTFLANMSHELRTPLNAILGFAQVMEIDSTLSVSHHQNVTTILRSGEHLLGLINDILDFSKIEAGHTEIHLSSFDIYDFLQGMHAMLTPQAQAKALTFELDLSPQLQRPIVSDPGKVRQILFNLLGNGLKFTRHGSIGLKVYFQPWPDAEPLPPYLQPASDGKLPFWLVCEVTDSGPGVQPQDQYRIFETFEQTEAGQTSANGTGLGLAISRRLVEILAGQIMLCSTPDAGSTFRVALPVLALTSNNSPGESRSRSSRPGSTVKLAPGLTYRILVVDDVVVNQRLIAQILQPLGFAVSIATSGQEAIDQWRQWQPQLILMDMRMEGMDGYAATAAIRAEEATRSDGQPVVIVAVTAAVLQEERERALAAGCNDLLAKPIRRASLLELIDYHLLQSSD